MSDLKKELQGRFKKLVTENSDQFSNDVSALFESTTISETDQKKFLDIMEATVQSKAVAIAQDSLTEMADNVDEYAEYVKESLEVKAEEYGEYVVAETAKNLDSYLGFVVEEFMKENKLAVENGIKADLFESLVVSMKEIFVENNIVVPEDGVDVVAELQESVNERDVTNDKLVNENAELRTELSSINKSKIISEATETLALTQKEKVLELAESLDHNDEFESKLKNIVEFVSKSPVEKAEIKETTTVTEISESVVSKNTSGKMNSYLNAAIG